jgi:hypothetical protein
MEISLKVVACTILLMSCCEHRSWVASSGLRGSLLVVVTLEVWLSICWAVLGETGGCGSSAMWRAITSCWDSSLLGDVEQEDGNKQGLLRDSVDWLMDNI